MNDSLEPLDTEDRSISEILVEESPNGIILTGADGRVRMLNRAVREIFPVIPEPLGRQRHPTEIHGQNKQMLEEHRTM